MNAADSAKRGPRERRARTAGAFHNHTYMDTIMEPFPTTSGHRRPAPRSRVTEHALLRYLERFEGVDVQAARDRLDEQLGGRIADLLEFAGNAPFRIRRGGDTFCGRGGRIVTCYRRGSIAT